LTWRRWKFISGYGSAKIIEIGQDLPKSLTQVYCHIYFRTSVYIRVPLYIVLTDKRCVHTPRRRECNFVIWPPNEAPRSPVVKIESFGAARGIHGQHGGDLMDARAGGINDVIESACRATTLHDVIAVGGHVVA